MTSPHTNTSLLSPSSLIDTASLIDDFDMSKDFDDFDPDATGPRKPHFLDYTVLPAPGIYYESSERKLSGDSTKRSASRPIKRTVDPFQSLPADESPRIDQSSHFSLAASSPKMIQSTDQTRSYLMAKFLDQSQGGTFRGTWPSDRPKDLTTLHGCVSADSPDRRLTSDDLLVLLGTTEAPYVSTKFLEMTKSVDTCLQLKRNECIPMLVHRMHSITCDSVNRKRAALALHNLVNCHPDDRAGRREAKVLRHIEQIMDYCEAQRSGQLDDRNEAMACDIDRHPSQALSSLMKISFDTDHRLVMSQLGAVQAIANLVTFDHSIHESDSKNPNCVSLRRVAGMALTNLTFGDTYNKVLLCSNSGYMRALLSQLDSSEDDLVQSTASILRNLSWRPDKQTQDVLNQFGIVTILSNVAMKNKHENTLRAILAALWNLSAHCSKNKAEFCSVSGALAFLVDMLTYQGPSKTLNITENAGGILSNVSSHIAVQESYRKILRERDCLGILLQQLKSESLTVVSNACGALWNLSARCPEDQKYLWDNGAVPMLRSLVRSKHKMIATGSHAALKNLLNFKPNAVGHPVVSTMASKPITANMKTLPTLSVRKQRAVIDHEYNKELFDPDLIDRDDKRIVTDVFSAEKHRVVLEKQRSKSPDQTGSNKTGELTDGTISVTSEIKSRSPSPESEEKSPTDDPVVYQETDLDQITDFSKRYAENHSEDATRRPSATQPVTSGANPTDQPIQDSVKCYQTEGTPYTISNAASVSDLRVTFKMDEQTKTGPMKLDASGVNTPEKPVKYCEEGTPGYFSIYESFSSLEDASGTITGVSVEVIDTKSLNSNNEPESNAGKSTTKLSELNIETPMMFSRHSSLESLLSAEPMIAAVDDRSSVVSDISRLASGIISPSEIPDSPTQCMPIIGGPARGQSPQTMTSALPVPSKSTRLRSVFEDDTNTFGVENTPAQFSCATSLSNLSLDDEPKIKIEPPKETTIISPPVDIQPPPVSQTSLSDTDSSTGDDQLLKDCINIGMTKNVTASKKPLSSDDDVSDSDFDQSILQKCIMDGMSKNTKLVIGGGQPGPSSQTPTIVGPKVFRPNQRIADDSEPPPLPERKNRPPPTGQPTDKPIQTVQVNDSLSSLSMDEEDSRLLSQVIADGMKGKDKRAGKPSDDQSFSSLDSIDDDQSAALLEQCIQAGIRSKDPVRSRSLRSYLPSAVRSTIRQPSSVPIMTITTTSTSTTTITTKSTANRPVRQSARQRERDRKDEQLLNDCIATGINSLTGNLSRPRPMVESQQQTTMLTGSKNGPTTSVAVPDSILNETVQYIAAIGVEIDQSNDRSDNVNVQNSRSMDDLLQQMKIDDIINEMDHRPIGYDTIASSIPLDKHKDPDLMLKSVERLTQELVSQAERLRKSSITDSSGDPTDMKSSSYSNCTWNEDTCTKDLLSDTPINFKIGGQVNQTALPSIGYFSAHDLPSTMVTLEANKVVEGLLQLSTGSLTGSSIDLNEIQPPSTLFDASINIDSTMKRSGPVKRYVLNGFGCRKPIIADSGSIDMIKPPSLMDELLDSMISVPSIATELLDDSMTLLPDDVSDATSIDSDFTSTTTADSVGSGQTIKMRTVKRRLTPRQRRQQVKDRYRTYTITMDRKFESDDGSIDDGIASATTTTETGESGITLTPRQKRQMDRTRFETQVLDTNSLLHNLTTIITDGKYPSDDHLLNVTTGSSAKLIGGEELQDVQSFCTITCHTNLGSLSTENLSIDHDVSCDYDQNSGTESSCDQNTYVVEGDDKPPTRPVIIKPTNVVQKIDKPIEGKGIRGRKKSPYISPYRQSMTTKTVRTNTGNKSVNKPTNSQASTTSGSVSVTKQTITSKSGIKSAYGGISKRIVTPNTSITTRNTTNRIPLARRSLPSKSDQPKSTVNSARQTIGGPVKSINGEQPETIPKLPERQGTFVKIEPSQDDLPIVSVEKATALSTGPKTRPPTKIKPPSPRRSLTTTNTTVSKPTNGLIRAHSMAGATSAPAISKIISKTQPSTRRSSPTLMTRPTTAPDKSNGNATTRLSNLTNRRTIGPKIVTTSKLLNNNVGK